jgi:hypothetical protein
MASPPSTLTEDQKEHFLQHGYIHLENCFTREQAAEVTSGVWTRLGMSPTDKTTWTKPRVHMPSHRIFDCAAFAPRAWAAICALCGGEARVTAASRQWRDSLIVNLGDSAMAGRPPTPPRHLDNWHVDGDFFVHYLDSPEQALLVIPLFSDVRAGGGGGTMLCPDALAHIARHLFAHPEGVSPRMVPRAHPDFARERNLAWYIDLVQGCGEFVEAAGKVGDVFLLHPLMLHSASHNVLRLPRMIINPPVSLREPHCFDRPGGDYSLVEQKTMRCLGGEEALKGWKITRPREPVVPQRVKIQEAMKMEEKRRMEEAVHVSVET